MVYSITIHNIHSKFFIIHHTFDRPYTTSFRNTYVKQAVNSEKQALQITASLFNYIYGEMFNTIWKRRCNIVIQFKYKQGITNKDKRSSPRSTFQNQLHTGKIDLHSYTNKGALLIGVE